jgi:hypothetical protein
MESRWSCDNARNNLEGINRAFDGARSGTTSKPILWIGAA